MRMHLSTSCSASSTPTYPAALTTAQGRCSVNARSAEPGSDRSSSRRVRMWYGSPRTSQARANAYPSVPVAPRITRGRKARSSMSTPGPAGAGDAERPFHVRPEHPVRAAPPARKCQQWKIIASTARGHHASALPAQSAAAFAPERRRAPVRRERTRPGYQQVPVERAEQRPHGDGAHIHAPEAQRLGTIPELLQPSQLLFVGLA